MSQTIEEPGSTPPSAPAQADGPARPPTPPAGSTHEHARRSRAAARRTRVVVRKIGPLSVLKVSLIFYFCMMLVVFLGLIFLWSFLSAIGVIDHVQSSLATLTNTDSFKIDSTWLFQRVFVAGCGMVVIGSFITVVMAFLYNLISDIVGGIEITLAEKR